MTIEAWEFLKKSEDYRSFLKLYVEYGSISLSDLSRTAGFNRGLANDIISGRRRITERSCYSFENAMKRLPSKGKKLFRLLVATEELDLFLHLNRKKIISSIEYLRSSSWDRKRKTISEKNTTSVFTEPNNAKVFAAISNEGEGTTFQYLQKVTQLPGSILKKSLSVLRSEDLVHSLDNVHFKTTNHHLFVETNSSNQALKALFSQGCIEASQKIKNDNSIEDDFFFTSFLAVSEEKVPELKVKLKKLILDYVDDSIEDGNKNTRMLRLTTALHL